MIDILRLRRAALLAAIVPLFAAGCGDIFGSGDLGRERDELADARGRWTRNGTDSYEMVVSRVCYCGPMQVRVRVQGGQVVSRVDPETGQPVTASWADGIDTVEDLFRFIDDALDEDPHEADAEYDDSRGFPTGAYFDFEENMADEENGFVVSGFTLLPVPVS
jgi:hypothetical protein